MSLAVLRFLCEEGIRFDGKDVLFIGVADEEAGMSHGSVFLTEKHADKVQGWVLMTEVGGFNQMPGKGRAVSKQDEVWPIAV